MIQYQLPKNQKRKCSITVYTECIVFEGRFLYLKEKEFYRNKQLQERIPIKEFMGMGYLEKRSYKKCLAFVFGGAVLSIMKVISDKANDMLEKVNTYLKWFDSSMTLPEWVDVALYVAVGVCLILGLGCILSKKKVVEFSFLRKRICVPRKSISEAEYKKIYQVIKGLQSP